MDVQRTGGYQGGSQDRPESDQAQPGQRAQRDRLSQQRPAGWTGPLDHGKGSRSRGSSQPCTKSATRLTNT